MAGMTDDPYFFERLLVISQCVEQEMESAGIDKPAFIGLLPGEIAIADYCMCNNTNASGQAWVRLAGITPLLSATTDPNNVRCMPPLEGLVEVGVLRCAPTYDVNNDPPTQQQQLETVRKVTADMAALLRALTCGCTGFGRGELRIVNWLPVAEAGGCVGGVWNVVLSQNYG